MTTLQTVTAEQANKETQYGENFVTLSAGGIFGLNPTPPHGGLTWGYYGGLYNSNTVADGTVALTNTSDNYVVVLRSTGVVSTSTSSANSVNPLYAKLYKVTCAAGVVSAVVDQRWDANGLMLSGGGSSVAANVPATRYTIELLNTTDSDPGPGLLKFNNATPASATFLYVDDATSDGVDLSTYFLGLGATGYVTIQSVADSGEWAIFKWTAITDGTGYFKFAVTSYASLGTLDDADAVLVAFDSDANVSGAVATDVIWDAAGDLVQGTGANAAARVPIGTALQVLRVNAGATAVEWAAAASGSGTKTYARLTPMTSQPPAANFATLDTRNSIAVLDFDDTTQESIFWVDVMPEAASLGSGLIVNIFFMSSTATSGNCSFGAQFERMNTDQDADSFDTATVATVATSATSGIVTKLSITCTTIDSIAAGDAYRVKIYRDTAGADTIVGDVEVVAVEVRSAA